MPGWTSQDQFEHERWQQNIDRDFVSVRQLEILLSDYRGQIADLQRRINEGTDVTGSFARATARANHRRAYIQRKLLELESLAARNQTPTPVEQEAPEYRLTFQAASRAWTPDLTLGTTDDSPDPDHAPPFTLSNVEGLTNNDVRRAIAGARYGQTAEVTADLQFDMNGLRLSHSPRGLGSSRGGITNMMNGLSVVINGQKSHVSLRMSSNAIHFMIQTERGSFRRELVRVRKFLHRTKDMELLEFVRQPSHWGECPFGLRTVDLGGNIQMIRELKEGND